MNTLITGSDGFIGKNLSKFLCQTNNIVNNLNLDDFYNNKKDDWCEILKKLLDDINPEIIFHVGACSDVLENNVNYMMEVNYEATKIMTDWVKNNDRKIIYSSSSAIYGINNKYPSSLYGWSKYVAEGYVVTNGGISLRYFNVYGPHEENKGKMSSIIYHMLKLKNDKPNESFKLFPVNASRDFIYVKDVVLANIFAMENYEKHSGKYYEVGSGESYLFENILNKIKLKFILSPQNEVPSGYQIYTCSNSKLWLNGWSPKYSLDNGIIDYKKYLKY